MSSVRPEKRAAEVSSLPPPRTAILGLCKSQRGSSISGDTRWQAVGNDLAGGESEPRAGAMVSEGVGSGRTSSGQGGRRLGFNASYVPASLCDFRFIPVFSGSQLSHHGEGS